MILNTFIRYKNYKRKMPTHYFVLSDAFWFVSHQVKHSSFIHADVQFRITSFWKDKIRKTLYIFLLQDCKFVNMANVRRTYHDITKSENDKRSYRGLELNNGLKVKYLKYKRTSITLKLNSCYLYQTQQQRSQQQP